MAILLYRHLYDHEPEKLTSSPAVVGYKITKKAQNLMEKEGVLKVVFSE
jgi:hypothetical protein